MSAWRDWLRFVGRRLVFLIIVLLGVSSITFTVTHLLGNPVYLMVGMRADQEMIDNMMHQMGLDRPIWEQYLSYLANVASGDLGVSRHTFNPVAEDIMRRLPATFELSTAALIIGVLWSVPMGLLGAMRQGGWADRVGRFVAQSGVAIPNFWLGLILIYLLFFKFQLVPAPLGRLDISMQPPPTKTGFYIVDSVLAGDWEKLRSVLGNLLMPAVTLAFTSSPPIFRLTRDTVVKILSSDYIRAARSYGFSEFSINFRFALKNALLPVTTMIAMTYGYLMGGTVLVETVFAWPGLGLYAVDAMNHSDYEPIVGVVLLSAAIYVVVYFLTDILHFAIDPRLRGE
jgi:ABC-type dipeptide/oligopeptide/nickel transport system permease component